MLTKSSMAKNLVKRTLNTPSGYENFISKIATQNNKNSKLINSRQQIRPESGMSFSNSTATSPKINKDKNKLNQSISNITNSKKGIYMQKWVYMGLLN